MLVVDDVREPFAEKKTGGIARFFEIQHEPVAVVVVPRILLVKPGQRRILIRRAGVFAIPVHDPIQTVGIDDGNLHEDDVLANGAGATPGRG